MLRRTVSCAKNLTVLQIRHRSTKFEPKPIADGNQWDLLVGVQIERLPIVSKTLTKLERDYQVLCEEKCLSCRDKSIYLLIYRNFRSS